MKIKYLGPGDAVNVEPYGRHLKDQVKDYPDDFADELLTTSTRQQFECVDTKPGKPKPKAPAKPDTKKAGE